MGTAHCIGPDGKVYWAQVFGKGDDNPQFAYDEHTCGPQSEIPLPPIAAPVAPRPEMPVVHPVPANIPHAVGPGISPVSPLTAIRYGPNGRPCRPRGMKSRVMVPAKVKKAKIRKVKRKI